ncbi:PE family protein [Aldersonia sp. NBC_00410]|uniref:PE family protein n=1 Tax=Aldersonia sp. NBC_00410 TaxID=2975954 RepID=UPI002250BB35|nr:PE family protein [Aldersonia sp. NBC_00410]MCX5046292.1 PE family protein [Aldersonia sp. NBC_00410]
MFLEVEPTALTSASLGVAGLVQQVTDAITATAVTVSALPPAGVDDASIVASSVFGAHGADFVGVGAQSQAMLGRAGVELDVIAAEYAAADAANTALLA